MELRFHNSCWSSRITYQITSRTCKSQWNFGCPDHVWMDNLQVEKQNPLRRSQSTSLSNYSCGELREIQWLPWNSASRTVPDHEAGRQADAAVRAGSHAGITRPRRFKITSPPMKLRIDKNSFPQNSETVVKPKTEWVCQQK